MISCCPNTKRTQTATCPANGKAYREVPLQTVMHHVKKVWRQNLEDLTFYFCTDLNCDVVYFSSDNSAFTRGDIRTSVGQKSCSRERTICYCFDLSWQDIQEDLQARKQFVVNQTRQATCHCMIRNPSGKCCLKDFPKQ